MLLGQRGIKKWDIKVFEWVKKIQLDNAIKDNDLSAVKKIVGNAKRQVCSVLDDKPLEKTFLYKALSYKHQEIADYLSQNLNSKWCTFLCAVSQNDVDVAKQMMEKDVDPNWEVCFGTGRNSLYLAVQSGNLDMVKLLVSYGADITTPDNSQKSPLDYAREGGQRDIVDWCDAVLENPMAYQEPARRVLVNKFGKMSFEELSAVPKWKPEWLDKLLALGLVAEAMGKMGYAKQKKFFEIVRPRIDKVTQNQLRDIVRETWQNGRV